LLNFFYDKTTSRFFLALAYDSNSICSSIGSFVFNFFIVQFETN
jgi:hypothetical protein